MARGTKENSRRKGTSPASKQTSSKRTSDRRSGSSRTKQEGRQQANGALKEWALDYLQQGWKVMRLPPRSKEPYPGKSQAACAITVDNAHTLRVDENLGVLFTTAGGLKDFDLDFQEAVSLAKAVGIPGAAFGRKSALGHYLFNAPGCEAKEFDLPEGKYPRDLPIHNGKPSLKVLEIRGNDNTYSMFPPSIHPCGEQLGWINGRRKPVDITAEELRALAGRHAVAAAVLYFYPINPTARYNVRMALTGALIRSGMSVDDTALYVRQVAKLAGDPKWKENFAKRTAERFQKDQKTTGLTNLVEVLGLPQACLDTFYEWLNDAPEPETAPVHEPPKRDWPVLDKAALYGLTGDVVKVIGPHTESDPVALVLQFHIAFGNAIGRSAFLLREGTKHFTNLYGVLVGASSKSRKGTSADRIRQLMSTALDMASSGWEKSAGSAARWVTECVQSGLSSGEGLIFQIRDEVSHVDKDGDKVIDVQGIDDKRLMLDEREFLQCLAVMRRDGSTASVMVRKGWDSLPLKSLTKGNTHLTACAEPHISISGHITEDELRGNLDQVSMANGYANRFLFACVRRSKLLPFGGNLQQRALDVLGKKVKGAWDKAYDIDKQFTFDAKAHALWGKVYARLSEEIPGLFGAVCARAEAQTLRLALVYAVLDSSKGKVKVQHLKAALALWQYYADSARYIFGDSLGDPIADTILQALRNNPNGITRTQIRDLFGRNQSSSKVDTALALLLRRGLATSELQSSEGKKGRRIEVWRIRS
jgi:hypothetical protein